MTDYPKLLVYGCSFQITVRQANLVLKFPCELFVQWKTPSGKKSVTSKNRVRLQNSVATFNQTIHFDSEALFDEDSQKFLKKQSFLVLNLITSSKPDPKLVGRIAIDLSDVLNGKNPYRQFKKHNLNYCSISGATLNFNLTLIQQNLLDKDPREVDKDSFTDYFSFQSGKSIVRQQRSVDSHNNQPRILKSRTTQARQIDNEKKFIRSSIVKKQDSEVFENNHSESNINSLTPRKGLNKESDRGIDLTKRNHVNILSELEKDKQSKQKKSVSKVPQTVIDRQKIRQKIRQKYPQLKNSHTERALEKIPYGRVQNQPQQKKQQSRQQRYQITQSFGPRNQQYLNLQQTNSDKTQVMEQKVKLEVRYETEKQKREWNIERLTLQNEMDKLKSQNTQLQLQNNRLKSKLQSLQKQSQDVKQKAISEKKKASSLTKSKEDLQMELQQLKANLKHQLNKKKVLENQLERLDKAHDEQTRKIRDNHTRELERMKQALTSKIQQQKQYRREVQNQNNMLKMMSKEDQNSGNQRVMQAMQELQNVRDSLESKLEQVRGKLDQARNKMEDERNLRIDVQDVNSQLKTKLAEYQSNFSAISQELQLLEQKHSAQLQKYQVLQNELAQAKQTSRNLEIANEQIAILEQKIDQLNISSNKEKQEFQKQLKQFHQNYEKLNQQLKAQIQKRKRAEQNYTTQQNDYHIKLDSLQNQLAATKKHLLDQLREQIEKRKLAEQSESRLKSEIQQINQLMQNERNVLREEITKLSEENYQSKIAKPENSQALLRENQKLKAEIKVLKEIPVIQTESVTSQPKAQSTPNKDYELLKTQVISLRLQVQGLQKYKQAAQEQIQDLKSNLKNQISLRQNQKSPDLQAENSVLLQQIEEYKKILNQEEHKIYMLEKQVEKLNRIAVSQAQINQQKAQQKGKESQVIQTVSNMKESGKNSIMKESGKFSSSSSVKMVSVQQFLREEEGRRIELQNRLNEKQAQLDIAIQQNMTIKFQLSELKQALWNEATKMDNTSERPVQGSNNGKDQQLIIEQLISQIKILEDQLIRKDHQLQATNQNLERQLARFTNQAQSNLFPSAISVIEDPSQKLKELQAQKEQLNQILKNNNEKIDFLQLENQQLKKRIFEIYSSHISQNDSMINEKYNQIQDQFAVINQLREKLEIQKNQAISQRDLANDQKDQLSKRNDFLQQEISKLQRQIEGYQRKIRELEQAITTNHISQSDKKIEIANMNSVIQQLQKQKEPLNASSKQLESLKQGIQQLQQQKTAFLQDKEILFSKNWKLEEDLQDMRETLKIKDNEIKGFQKQLQRREKAFLQDKQILFSKNWKMEEDMQDMREIIKMKDNEITRIQRELNKLKALIVQLNEKVSFAEDQKNLAEEMYQTKNQQCEQISLQLQNNNKQLQTLRSANQNDARTISDLKSRVSELSLANSSLQNSKALNSELHEKLLRRNKELQNENAQLKQMNENLMGGDRNLASKLQQAQYVNLRSSEEIDYLTTQITDLNTKLEAQIIKTQQLEDKIVKYSEKQVKMRQNVAILQEQSRKIYELVQQKEQNQEKYEQMIQQRDTAYMMLKKNQAQLVQEIDHLNMNLEQLNEQIKHRQNAIQRLNERLINERGQIADQSSRLQSEANRASRLQQYVKELQNAVNQKTDQIKHLELENSEKNRINIGLGVQNEQLITQITNLNIEKEEVINKGVIERQKLQKILSEQFALKQNQLMNRIKQYSLRIQNLEKANRKLKSEVDAGALQGESSKYQVQELEGQIKAINQNIDALTVSLNQKNSELIKKQQQLNQLRSQINQLHGNVDKSEQNVSQLRRRIQESQHYITELQNLKNGVQSDSQKAQQQLMMELRKLKIEYDEVSKGNQEMGKIISQKDQQIDEQRQKLQSFDQEMAQLNEKLTSINNETQIYIAKIQQEAKAQIQKLQQEIEQKEKKIEQFSQKIATLQQNLLLANNTINNLVQQKAYAKEELGLANQKSKEEIEKLMKQLTTADQTIVCQCAQIQQLNRIKLQLQNQARLSDDQMRNCNIQLEQVNHTLNKNIKEVNDNIEVFEKGIEALQDQNKNLIDKLAETQNQCAVLKANMEFLEGKIEEQVKINQQLENQKKKLLQKLIQNQNMYAIAKANLNMFENAAQQLKYNDVQTKRMRTQENSQENGDLMQSRKMKNTASVGNFIGSEIQRDKQLSQKMSSIEQSMRQLEGQNYQMNDQIQQMQGVIMQIEKQKQMLYDQVNAYQSDLQKLSQQLANAESQKQKLALRVDQISRTLEDLQNQNAKLAESRRILENKLVNNNMSNEQNNSNIRDIFLKQKDDEISFLTEKLKVLTAEIQNIDIINQQNEKLCKQLEKIEQELFAFNSTDNQKTMLIDQLRQENNKLKEFIEHMKMNMGENQGIIASQDQKIYELNNIINQLSSQSQDIYIKSYPMGKQEYQGQMDGKNYHSSPSHVPLANEDRAQITVLNRKLTAMALEIQDLTAALLTAQQQIKDLQQGISPRQDFVVSNGQFTRIRKLQSELEDHKNRQVEQMNSLLDLKLKLKEEQAEKAKLKKQLTDRSREHGYEQLKLAVSDPTTSAFNQVFGNILKLLQKRSKRQEIESVVQLLVGNNAALEQRFQRFTQQRGAIQERARTISMQFQVLKSYILKGKFSRQDKQGLLLKIKPSEIAVGEMVRLSETLTDSKY